MKDPAVVIEQWTEVWNTGLLDLIPALVAEPCLRHHPGHLDVVTVAENVERVRAGREVRFPGVVFENVVLAADGEFVTSVYTMRWRAPDDADRERDAAGIEVFRVVEGRIAETWNVDPGRGPWR